MHSRTSPVELRHLAARDSVEALTALLHRAYAPLAVQGMNFTAATQSAEQTRKRIALGQCLVAVHQAELVGMVTVSGPLDVQRAPWSAMAPWSFDPETAHFHQIAVDPRWQGQGIGRRLVLACEEWARDCGYRRLALDAAEPATAVQAMYRRMGYAEMGHTQRPGKTYRTVSMRKSLDRSALGEHLQVMARYNLWATQKLMAAVGALPDAEYRRDVGLFFKSVHGTLNHLLVGEHLLWFRRFAEGVSDARRLDEEAEPDRGRLRQRLIDGATAWLPLLDVWPDQRLHGQLNYRRTTGEALSLPFAATLLHVFNHGTHHRGQITAALTMLGRPAPEIDLVAMLQQDNAKP